ncbi:MAG: hypothetical protein ACTSU5_13075 [Promethearchaeota archaeon]
MDRRFFVAIFAGIAWMLFAPFFFSEWRFGYWDTTLEGIFQYIAARQWQRGFLTWIGCGFQGDLVAAVVGFHFSASYVYQTFVLDNVMFASLMAWFSAGVLCGVVSGGAKRGMATSFLGFTVFFGSWLLLNVFAGEDLALIFSYYLAQTMGGIFTGVAFSLAGGAAGGAIGHNPND